MTISDDDLLSILRDEKLRALGFDGISDFTSPELLEKRQTALNYYKGDMSNDMPTLENRSGAVSHDVRNVVKQALPDIVEIFLTEDIASFQPMNEQDIPMAQQETEYVNWVVFQQNNGFDLLNTTFMDALLLGVGYLMWYWEDSPDPEQETFENVTELELMNANLTAGDRLSDVINNEDGTFTFTITAPAKEGKICITAWSPDDVAVSEDTISLGKGTYCAFRSRVRRQELYADYDADVVDNLPRFGNNYSEVEIARDQSGETTHWLGGSSEAGFDFVEIIYHYIRVYEDDHKTPTLYHVVTGGQDCSTILKKEVVDEVPACAFKPFPIPHRFFGESLADFTIETQRIKTALLRMGLDHGYYAMNQRMEVAQDGVTKHTLTDILNNVPGAPIRVKHTGTVVPVAAGTLNFDVFGAFEFINNMKEEDAGVSRAAMGIAPDSMHDTASGQLAIMNSAQRRVRFIARNFAETGVKDLFRGVHKLLRQNATIAQTVRLLGKWVQVDPTSWSLREDLVIEIGNAGGRDYDMANFQALTGLQAEAVKAQGGPDGPLTNPKFLLTTAQKMTSRMGLKNPEQYWPDPQAFEQMQAQQAQQGPQPPAPDPKVMQMQAEMQMKGQQSMQELQLKQQLAQQEFEFNRQMDMAKFEHQKQLDIMKTQIDADKGMAMVKTQQAQIAAELELKQHEQQLEALLNREALYVSDHNTKMKMNLDHTNTALDRDLQNKQLEQDTDISPVRPGGSPLS